MLGAFPGNPGPAWKAAAAQSQANNRDRAKAMPAPQRQAMNHALNQMQADFAPAPEPMQQPRQRDNEPLLHGLVGHTPRAPQDWRAGVYEQGTEALNRAVEDTNEAWAKEMDRRAEHANDERDRQHELDLEAMQQQGNAEREAAAMQHEQSKQAFLANLLASSGMVPRTLRFGG